MIIAINYADEKYRRAQKFNSKRALKYGADRVIEYTPDMISKKFKEQYCNIWNAPRGGGYWVWKPYIILDALQNIVTENDYLVYTDAGSAFVNSINYLIDAMERENTDIMCFAIDQVEKKWDKRDAVILLDCDKDEYLDTAQICGGYIIVKKTSESVEHIKRWFDYCLDERIISDNPNVLGYDNYPEFVGNRHDQTVWSLCCKKKGIKPFRDPSQWGNDQSRFADDVLNRSDYPQIIDSHRRGWIHYGFQLEYNKKWWFYPMRKLVRAWYKILRMLGSEYGKI